MDIPSPARASVLVVEDEPGLRDVLLYGLKRKGFEVQCAPDGESAMVLARQTEFDLAVCDIMMPGINGVSVLQQIKEICPTTEVIMVTGFATLETAVASMKKGAYDYISKPFSMNNLCAILEKALDRRRLMAKVHHLEELNRLKSDSIAVVSHELRTPMSGVMAFVTLMLKGAYGPPTPPQEEALRRVLMSVDDMVALITNILDLSKLSANKESISEEVFELHSVARQVIDSLEPLADEQGLTLALEASEDLWVRTDHPKIKQILVNLLGNALKFTPKGGRITLRLLSGGDPTRILIQVADTGIGIKKEQMPMLFQEFEQLNTSGTHKRGGVGLGLCITKKIVDLMGGTIRVDSEFGSGTTFTLDLPVRTSRPEADVPDPTSAPVPPDSEAGTKAA